MLASKTRWKLQQVDMEQAKSLADQCDIHPLIARLLLIRGITTEAEVAGFLHHNREDLHDPYLLDHMEQAVARIKLAVERQERIRIYGDYDADGVSSTALMIWLMRELGATHDYYIPHRVQEGYGLNCAAIDQAKRDGIGLIITVDTGISACEEAEHAGEVGIDLIITDHHEPPEQLPQALAVINPKKPGCKYPFKQLAGAGVALKLAQAITGQASGKLCELAALGTIADLMPLTGENRLIVKLGLEHMQNSSFAGLRALFHVCGIADKQISAGHIGFAIAPRINAGGRLDSADSAVQLLITEQDQEAEGLAIDLDQLNKERQRIVEETLLEAHEQVAATDDRHAMVVLAAKENWNAGVIGIVAARLLDYYYRPSLVFTLDKETGLAKGSARSITGFDIHKALTQCADILERYGGHQAAAGMTLPIEYLPDLQQRLSQLAEEWLMEEDLQPATDADGIAQIAQCSIEFIEQLQDLAPYGKGNSGPRFILEDMRILEMRRLGKEGQHLKLSLGDQEGRRMDAIGFRLGDRFREISPTSMIDVLGELQVNEWNGILKPQLVLQDIRIKEVQVYDWRGIRMEEVDGNRDALLERLAGWREDAAFIITDEHSKERERIESVFGSDSIWMINAEGQLQSIGSKAAGESIPRDLIFVHMPSHAEWIESALLRYRSKIERIVVWFVNADGLHAVCPSRERFKTVYASLRQQQRWDLSDDRLLASWSRRSGLPQQEITFILNVFEELGFIKNDSGVCECIPRPEHKDLKESILYDNRQQLQQTNELFMMQSTSQLTEWVRNIISAGGHKDELQRAYSGD